MKITVFLIMQNKSEKEVSIRVGYSREIFEEVQKKLYKKRNEAW